MIIKYIYIILGSLSFVAGVIGIVLPVMPTTPFLILSAVLFARSSEKLYNKLLSQPKYGHLIKGYLDERKIPLKTKAWAISLLLISTTVSSIFFIDSNITRIIFWTIIVSVSIYIISLETKT